MQVVPERSRIPNLTAEECVGNHRKHQTQPKGKCQKRQEGSHCVKRRLLGIAGKGHNEKRQSKEDNCMKKESKRCRTSISGNPGKDTVYKPKGHWIGDQEEDQCRVEGELHFQTSGESHLEYVGDFS